MSLGNNSYITGLDELGWLTNYHQWKALCTIDEDAVDPADALATVRLDRCYAALNFGKDSVDSVLKYVYTVPFVEQAVSNSYPNWLVKRWNVRFGLLFMYQLHVDREDGPPEQFNTILDDIEPFIRPSGLTLIGQERTGQVSVEIAGGKRFEGTLFDLAGYWSDRIIVPPDERDAGRWQGT